MLMEQKVSSLKMMNSMRRVSEITLCKLREDPKALCVLCSDVRAEEKQAIYHGGKTGGSNFHVLISKHSDVSALPTFFCL